MIYQPALTTTPHLFMLPIGEWGGAKVGMGGAFLFPACAVYWQAITGAHQS